MTTEIPSSLPGNVPLVDHDPVLFDLIEKEKVGHASSGAGWGIPEVGHGGAVEVKGVYTIHALTSSCSKLHGVVWCCVVYLLHKALAAIVAAGCTTVQATVVSQVELRSWL